VPPSSTIRVLTLASARPALVVSRHATQLHPPHWNDGAVVRSPGRGQFLGTDIADDWILGI
jgi:hypothetical protein